MGQYVKEISFPLEENDQEICLAVFSDSHGDNLSLARAVDSASLQTVIHGALHLGDFSADLSIIQKMKPLWPAYAVRGNNDWDIAGVNDELIVAVGATKVYLAHGHRHSASVRVRKLAQRAASLSANVVCFGHTHVALVNEVDDILVVNPGSCAYPREDAGPSYAILRICPDGSQPSAEIHRLLF